MLGVHVSHGCLMVSDSGHISTCSRHVAQTSYQHQHQYMLMLVRCLPTQDLAQPEEATQGWTNPRERRVFDEQMDGQTDGCMDG